MSTNTKLAEALAQYEAALLSVYPAGARGAAFDCWNKARQALAAHDAEQAAQAVPAVPVAYADPEDLTDADGNWIEDGNWVTVRLKSSWPLPAELRHYIPLYATAAPAPGATK